MSTQAGLVKCLAPLAGSEARQAGVQDCSPRCQSYEPVAVNPVWPRPQIQDEVGAEPVAPKTGQYKLNFTYSLYFLFDE